MKFIIDIVCGMFLPIGTLLISVGVHNNDRVTILIEKRELI